MSEKLLKVLLEELRVVRVVCKGTLADGSKCQTIIEVPVAKLEHLFGRGCQCHVCHNTLAVFDKPGVGRDPFAPLVQALRDLESVKDKVGVEFVIPQKD